MTNEELISRCAQVASLTDSINRFAFAINENRNDLVLVQFNQRWHDNRVIERDEVLTLIRDEI